MDTKTLEKKIRDIHKSSDEFKSALEAEFGKEFFNQKVTERVTTKADAFEETGRPTGIEFTELPEDLRPFFKAVYDVVVINEALNEKKRFDLYDTATPRYYPWWNTKGSLSAFAFLDSNYDHSLANAGSGSRLCVKNDELVQHIAKYFKDENRAMLEL